jgi:hypothetical protein
MTCIATSQGSAETKVKVGDLMAKLGGKIWIKLNWQSCEMIISN